MVSRILAQEGGSENLIYHVDYGPWGPNPEMYVILFCAAMILASGIYGLIAARKKPGRLTHALLLHGFVLIAVMAIGAAASFLGVRSSVGTFETSGAPDPFQVMKDQSFMAMNGIRFAVVVGVGAIMGAVALLIKRSPESK